MLSLFADQEREAKLDSLADPLALLDNSRCSASVQVGVL